MVQLSDDLHPIRAASQLTSLSRFVGSPVWSADGRDILFLSGESQWGGQLWRLRLPATGAFPTQPEVLPGPFENSKLLSIRFHQDGSARVAYMRHYFEPRIVALDLKDASTPAQAPRAVLASTAGDNLPQFSPDGRSIVFSSFRSGTPEVWKSDRDGSNPVQLTNMKGPFVSWPSWSPDGRWIVFESGPAGNSDLYVIASDGGTPKRLTHSPANEVDASWSRNGRSIYFSSDRGGNRQVWKMRFQADSSASSEELIQVTKRGGWRNQESPDGKILYFTNGSGSLRSVPVDGGEERQVIESIGMHSFFPASTGIYFVASTPYSAPGRIQFLSSRTGKITTVLQMDKPAWLGLSLSPDGGTLLLSQVGREESDLKMVDRWRP
jgi:Tol biopolymer transport system component